MNLRGVASLIVAIVLVVGFILWIPALKYFLLGALGMGVIVVFVLPGMPASRSRLLKTNRFGFT